MPQEIVLFGTGDFARVACAYLEQDSPYKVAAFTVHKAFRKEPTLLGKPVVAVEDIVREYPPERYGMFVAMGYRKLNKLRAEVYTSCKNLGYKLITYIHSRATVFPGIEIGDNCFIFENNVVQPFVKIGCNTIIWSGNHIGHDSVVGNHCFIASHAVISGNVRIGDNCFIGVNSTIRDGVTVGNESVLGAGALILSDAAPNSVFQGQATEVSRVPSNRLRDI